MSIVYVTQTGSRYHGQRDLKCLENAKGINAIDLATAAAGGLTPCLGCEAPPLPEFTEGDHRWLRTIDGWSRTAMFDSMWEQAFARRVLAQIPNLGADDVEIQSYVKVGAESFKVDFLIPRARLVLEVDGFTKSGDAPTAHDLERRNRRDAALQGQGYKVLHFSNAQVQQEPQACRVQVQGLLTEGTHETKPSAPLQTGSPTDPVSPGTTAALRQSVPSTSTPPMPKTAVPSTGSRRGMWILISSASVAAAIVLLILISANGPQTGTTSPQQQVDAQTSTTKTDSSQISAPTPTEQSTLPVNGQCPTSFPFKGNINDKGEKIVHAPGQEFYSKVKPEMCFITIEAALSNGYRASKV